MTLGLLAIAAGAGLLGGTVWGATSASKQNAFNKEYNAYKKDLKTKGLNDVSTKDLIEDLWLNGSIDESEYKKALSTYARLEDNLKQDGLGDSIGDTFSSLFKSRKTYNAVADLYKTIATNAPNLSWANGKTYDEIVNAVNANFKSNLPSISNAPTPEYLDTMFEGTQIDVTEAKDWTAKDLAELHDINFDPNYYYDLIKQGTEANLALGKFTNKQLDTLATSQDTKSIVGYLDSIRNAKANALSNGATLGAKAAAEILANTTAIENYAGTQAQTANTKAQNMASLLQEDAYANITARKYYDQLANDLATDAALAYDADVQRYGEELITNAELYKADQELRGQRLLSNAEMYAQQLATNAAINMYRSDMNLASNEYAWLFQNALKAKNKTKYTGSDVFDAYGVVNDYIFNNTNRNVGNDRTTYINNLIS